jgi:hypothetical protein
MPEQKSTKNDRRSPSNNESLSAPAARPGPQKARAERFPIETQVRFREKGEPDWNEGTTLNISRTGILFRTPRALPPSTVIEMQILFPAEITGGPPANVLCWGPIVRAQAPAEPNLDPAQAAAIVNYRFTHD